MEDYRETERRRNGGTVFNEPYSESAVYRFKQLVQKFYELNERKFYSILVDGETVVKKTSDSRKFERYQDFMNEFTKKVEVRIFINDHPNSPNCNRYIFRMGGALAGVTNTTTDIKALIDSKVKKKMKKQQLQAENKQYKKEILKLEEAVASAPKYDVNQILTRVGGMVSAFTGKKIPLAGVPVTQRNESEVTVDIEEESDPTNQEKQAKHLFSALVESQGIEKILKTLELLKIIGENPDIGKKVKEMLNNKN